MRSDTSLVRRGHACLCALSCVPAVPAVPAGLPVSVPSPPHCHIWMSLQVLREYRRRTLVTSASALTKAGKILQSNPFYFPCKLAGSFLMGDHDFYFTLYIYGSFSYRHFFFLDRQVCRSVVYFTERGAKMKDADLTPSSRPRDHLLGPLHAFQQSGHSMASWLFPQKHRFPSAQEQSSIYLLPGAGPTTLLILWSSESANVCHVGLSLL